MNQPAKTLPAEEAAAENPTNEVGNLPQIASDTEKVLSVIERLATDPAVDVEKMNAVLDMQERILDKRALMEFNRAMNRCQLKMEPIAKKAWNEGTGSHYAKLEHITAQIKPVYVEEGFSLSFDNGDSPLENHYRILCEVSHVEGHSKIYHIDLPADLNGLKGNANKTMLHAVASTNTYGQRYVSCNIFNLVLEGTDNDGNAPANTAPANGEATLNPAQLKELKAHIVSAGATQKYLCEVADVSKLEEITQKRLRGAIAHLNNLKAKKEKANAGN